MKSGLYSTFTIQSLQVSPGSQPVKTELLLPADPIPKVTRLSKEVGMNVCSRRLYFLPGFLLHLGVLVIFFRCVSWQSLNLHLQQVAVLTLLFR